MAKPEDTDALTKAINKLRKAQEASIITEKARAALGMSTSASRAAQKSENDRLRVVQDSQRKIAMAIRKADDDARRVAKSADAWQRRSDSTNEREAKNSAKRVGKLKLYEEQAHATQAAENAATSAAAEAAAIGAVEAVAMATVTAVVALATATAWLAAKAIEVTEQRAALLATFAALGGGAAAGKQTLAMVDALSEKLPMAASQIATVTKNLESAGFRGQALGKAVEAVAAATAIMHDESGGAAAQKMLQVLAEGGQGAKKMADAISKGGAKSNKLLQQMGLSSKDVTLALKEMGVKGTASADQVGMAVEKALAKKGKGPLEEMAMTMPVMLAKLKEGFLSLFEGLGPSVKPFMTAVQSLFGQFTRGKAPMKALRAVVTEVFGTIFRYATMAVKAVSAFVKENFTAKNVASTWNDIKTRVAQVVNVLGKVWSVMGPIVTSKPFLDSLAMVFKIIGVVVLVTVSAMATLSAMMGALAAAVMFLGGALWSAIGSLINLAAAGIGAVNEFVAGLVQGILNGIGDFVAAVSAMASAGLAAFKSIFQINSPSAVMDQMGGHVAEGAAQGVEGGQGRVEGAATKLGAGMIGATAGGAKGGKSGAGGGITVNGGLHLHASAGTTESMAEELFAAFLDRMATMAGA